MCLQDLQGRRHGFNLDLCKNVTRPWRCNLNRNLLGHKLFVLGLSLNLDSLHYFTWDLDH